MSLTDMAYIYEELFYKNGRPIALLVRSEDGYSNLHKFNDSMGMQRITFTRPIKAKYISFTIMEVAPGRKSDDTCISEISLFQLKREGKAPGML